MKPQRDDIPQYAVSQIRWRVCTSIPLSRKPSPAWGVGLPPPAGAQFNGLDALPHGLTPVAAGVSPPAGAWQNNEAQYPWLRLLAPSRPAVFSTSSQNAAPLSIAPRPAPEPENLRLLAPPGRGGTFLSHGRQPVDTEGRRISRAPAGGATSNGKIRKIRHRIYE
jgi:hypothetical protein